MTFRELKKKESANRIAARRALSLAPLLLFFVFSFDLSSALHAATKVYLQDSASSIDPGANIEKELTRFAGTGLVTYTVNTVRGAVTPPTAATQLTDTAGGTDVIWYSDPLDAVTISGNVTFNIWAQENNIAANATITAELLRANNSGAISSVIAAVTLARPELSATTMLAQNWVRAPAATALANGDRLAVRVYMDDGSGVTMGRNYTVSATLGGSSDGFNGDSWVQVTEALAPMRPSITALTDVYTSSVAASWQLAGAATGYTLAASVNSANPPSPIAASSTTLGDLSAALEGLAANTTYYLFVRANGPGASSSWAAYSGTATLAAVPAFSNFTNVAESVVRANWTDGNPAGTLYRVKVSTAPDPLNPGVGQVVTTSNTYNAYLSSSGLAANTTYYFRVAGVNKNGVETAYAAAAGTSTWANVPAFTSFTGVAEGAVQLNWDPANNRSPGTLYRVKTSTASDPFNPGTGQVVTTSDTYGVSLSTTGLAANTTYYFRVVAVNNNGVVSGDFAKSTSTWANMPAFDGFAGVSSGSVRFNWTGSNPEGTLYRVKVSTAPNPLLPPAGAVVTTSDTYNVYLSSAGLAPDTTYYFRVAGVNKNGIVSNYTTAEGTATLLALDPAFNNFTNVSESVVRFNWTGNNPAGTLYRVKVSTAPNPLLPPAGAVVTASDTYNAYLSSSGLAPNTTYYFRVAGVNKNGVETNYTLAAGTSTWAAPPSGFTFSGFTPSALRLNWSAAGNGPGALYRVLVSTGTDPKNPAPGEVVTSSDTYNVYLTSSGLGAYTDYYFRVGVFNNNGVFTDYAAPVTERTLPGDQLGEPVAVSVSPIFVTSMTATWQLVANATGYTLAASVNPGNPPSPVLTSSTTAGNLNLSASVFNPALNANTNYYLFVRANGPGVVSSWAAYPGVSTRLQYAPVFSAFTDVAENSAKFNWTDGNPAGIKYRVMVSTAPDPLNPPLGAVVTTSDTYNMSLSSAGLNADTTYYFRVAGLNNDGLATAYSAPQSTSTRANVPVFDSFTGVAEGAVQLNWGANGNRSPGTLYRVKASTALDPFLPGVGQVVTTSDTYNTYLSTAGLAANTTYYFRVVAVNNGGTVTGDLARSTSTLANVPASTGFTGVAEGSIQLNWDPNGNRSPGTLYRVKASTASDPFNPGAGQVVTTSDTYNAYLSTSGLAANATYYFRVAAVNNNGVVSGDFARSTSTWANMPVFNGFTSVSSCTVRFNWTGNNPAGTLYRVKVSSADNPLSPPAGEVVTTSDTYNVYLSSAGLAPNVTYYFRVAGVNKNGVVTDYITAQGTSTIAAVPVFSAFSNITPYAIKFKWSAAGNPYPGTLYRVVISTAADPKAPGGAEVAVSETYELEASFSGLLAATTYYFRAAGVNNNGIEAEYSLPQSTVTLPAPPSTKLYFQDSVASVDANSRQLTVSNGGGLFTYTKDTLAGTNIPPAAATQFTETSGGANVTWYSYPLDSVLISGDVTFNIWARESGFKGNAAITAELLRADGSGNILSTVASVVLNRTELSNSALTMENWGRTPAPVTLLNGDRLAVRWYIGNGSGVTMAAGETVTATLGGATPGANGDSWVRLTEGLAPARPALGAISNVSAYAMTAGWQLVEGATGYTLAASINPDNPPYPVFTSSTTLGDLNATLSVPALSPNTTYYLFARTNGGGTSSSWSAYAGTSTLLAYPPAFDNFTNVNAGAIQFNWLHNNNPAGTLYRVAVSTAPQPLAPAGAAATVVNTYAITLASSGLSANTTYYFNVAGLNNNGVATSSITLATSTLANAPAFDNFTDVSTGAIRFNWLPNGNRAPGTLYRVLVSSSANMSAATSSDTYNLSLSSAGLAANVTHYFRVSAISNNGVVAGYIDASTSTWARVPALDAFTEISTGSVKFAWLPDNNRSPGTLYRVLVSSSANMSAATSSDTYNLSLSSAGLAANATCYFRVSAINNNGVAAAGYLDASTSTWARAPVFDNFTAISSGAVRFNWLPESGRTLYRVQVSSSANMSAATSSDTYNAYLSSGGLAANTTYYFNAVGINNNGVLTDYTGVKSTATWLEYDPAFSNFTNVSGNTVRFNWTDSNPAGTLYRVKVSTAPEPFSPPPGAVVTASDTYNVYLSSSGLAPNTTYYFTVAGLNHNGVPTSYTAAKGTSTWAVLPAGLNFSGITPGMIRLNWSGAGNGPGTLYRVKVSTASDPSNPGTGQVVTASDTYNVYLASSGLNFETVYYFQAGAFNNNGIFTGYTGVENAATLPEGGIGIPVVGAVTEIYVASMTANWGLVSGATGYTLAASINPGNPPSPVYASSVTVGDLSAVIGNLAPAPPLGPNTTYYLFVRANGPDATSPWAAYPGISTRLEFAPVFTNFTNVAENSVRFNWSDGNPAGTRYRVKVSTAPDPLSPPAGAVVTTSDTYNVYLSSAGLGADTTYYFRVAGLNNNGLATAYTAAQSTSTLAAAPGFSGFVEISTGALRFNWLPNGNRDPGTLYRVLVSSSANMSAAVSSDTYGLSLSSAGLSANATYYFRAAAINSNGLVTAAIDASTSTWARAPVFTAFTNVAGTSLRFNWSEDNNPQNTLYRVLVSTSANMSAATSSDTYNTYLSSSGLAPNTTHYFRAAGVNKNGVETAYTELQGTATLANLPLTAVSTFSGVAVAGFTAGWDRNSNPFGTVYTVQVSTAQNFNSGAVNQAAASTAPAAGPAYTFTGLTFSTDYYFRVRAANRNGVYTDYAELGSTRTLGLQPPAIGSIVNVYAGSLEADWQLAESATGYTLAASLDPDNPPSSVYASSTTVGGGALVYSPALSPNTTHYLFVRSNGPGESSPWAAYPPVSTLANPPVSAVSTFSAVEFDRVLARWGNNSNPLGGTIYTVELSTAPNFNEAASHVTRTTEPATGPDYLFEGLDPDTLYYFRVRAQHNGGGFTDWVNLGYVQTKAAVVIHNAGDGVVFYGQAGNTMPQFRRYISGTNTFEAAANTLAGEAGSLFVIKTSPLTTKQEAVAGYVKDGTLHVLCTDGNNWSEEWTQAVGGGEKTRRFDIAYETNSGDVLVLYSRDAAGSNELGYRVKPGGAGCDPANWSANTNLDPLRTGGYVHWVKLASDRRAAADTIAAIWADGNAYLSAMVWNGTAWENEPSTPLESSLEVVTAGQDVEDFDVEFESLTGDLMVVWANSAGNSTVNGVRVATAAWTGGNPLHTWGKPYAPATFADDATNLDLAANPNSDEMIFASVGDGAKTAGNAALQIGYWSGTAWSNNANVDITCQLPLAGTKLVAAGWLTAGAATRWVVSYNDAAAANIGWYYGTTGVPTAGADAAPAPAFANPQKYYDIRQDPLNKDRLVLTVADNASDLLAKRLVMTSVPAFTWTDANGGAALETNLASATAGGYSFGFWPAPPSPTFVQSGYRFFANTDTADAGAPLAAQDTLALLGGAGTAFRLRTLLHVGQVDLPLNGQGFKLQFAGRGEGTCAAPLNGTPAVYTDVTGASLIAFKNNSPADNTALTANAQDPKHGTHLTVNQTYEELNNSTNSIAAIAANKDGMWDFALKDNGMTPGTAYCLRLSSGDGAPLNGYDVYPEIVLPAAVYINEVYPSSNTTGVDGWVEFFNNTASTPTLIGWKLNYVQGPIGSENSPTTVWTGQAGDVINAKSTFTIYGLTLNAAGHHVKLLDNAANIVDQVQWPGLAVGQSFARITDGEPVLFEIDPTPTKNYANYVATDVLKINEVAYGALGGQFIELYNASVTSTRTLTGYSLRNSNGQVFKFTRKIYPQNYAVLDFSSTGEDARPYAGDQGAFGTQGLAASGDFLTLENSTGSTVDHVTWQTSAAAGYSRYNYRAELVSAGTGNFALGNSTISISRQPTEGADSAGGDSVDFGFSTFTTIGSRNNSAGSAAANTLVYPLDAAVPQFLARKFPITLTVGAKSSTGTANSVIFTRTGGSGDAWSPHIYRLADIGFDLDTLTAQTTVQTGFAFNDQDGRPLVSSASYRVVFNTDTGTKSARQIILGTVTYEAAVHTVTASTAAPLWLNDAVRDSAVKLDISNNSPAGFNSLEVTTVTFSLLGPDLLAALDTPKAKNLFNAIMLVRDSTSAGTYGLYEPGIDVSTIAYVPMEAISLDAAGVSTLTVLSPDLPSASIPAASTRTFYVVFEATQNASGWAPDNVFRVRLDPPTVAVRDGPADLPQDFSSSAQVETSSVTLIAPARPPTGTDWPYALPAQAVVQAPAGVPDPDLAAAADPPVTSAVYLPASDGYLRALNKDGTIKWSYNTNSLSPIRVSPTVRIEGSVVSTGVYIYFANDNGDVYKVRDTDDPGGPAFEWKTSIPGGYAIKSSITDIDTDPRLYFGADDNKIHCLKKADGQPCSGWSSVSVGNSPISGSLVLDSRPGVNTGWVANEAGDVMALDLEFGTSNKVLNTTGVNMRTSPYLDARVADPNNIIYITSPSKKLYARVSANMTGQPTGWPLNDYDAGADINTSPTMDFLGAKYIYFGDDAGKLHKVSTEGASAAGWPFQVPSGKAIRSSPVWVPGVAVGLAEDYVYFGCDDGYIYAINADDGARRPGWPVAAGAPVRADIVADTDTKTIIVSSTDGKVHVLYIGGP